MRLIKPPTVDPAFAEAVPLALIVQSILGGFASLAAAIGDLVDNDYIAALPIINDHSRELADIRELVEQRILQGEALIVYDNELYFPPRELVSLDVILIAAGAGGAAGKWDLITDNRRGGAGGGGGGEIHLSIPAAMLPKDANGEYLPIQIGIGAGGSGGVGSEAPGQGGGDCDFGGMLAAGGGVGGTSGGLNVNGVGGLGGSGMIPGGRGGNGGGFVTLGLEPVLPTTGGNSTSPYELYGGGGGGGGGGGVAWNSPAGVGASGGIGGISRGGASNGAAGDEPSDIVATGAGGGAGSNSESNVDGGAGGFPGGGGGGGNGGSNATNNGDGGDGGNAVAYLLERFS